MLREKFEKHWCGVEGKVNAAYLAPD